MLPIDRDQLGAIEVVARDRRREWLDVVELRRAESAALFGLTEDAVEDRLDEYTGDRNGRWFYTERHPRSPLFVLDGATRPRAISLPAGQARLLSVSPEGSKIAVVQFRLRDDGFTEDHLLSIFATESGERLWTIGSTEGFATPRWAGDGSRIIAQGKVRDAATGEEVVSLALQGTTLVIEDRSDAEWAKHQPEARRTFRFKRSRHAFTD